MPPAPSALAAAPASSCFRVSRTLRLGRLDEGEAAQDAIEVLTHLAVAERRRDMLARRVQRPGVSPGIQDVPLIRVLVDVVDPGDDGALVHRPPEVAEAGDQLAALRVGVDASRYPSTVR